ncbi:MAG: DUF899 domain-containing protein [Actinobacteria bacterium]|nr:MAG: DUF899 domain-containing protein [Actinomycetota bacterium]
MTGLWVVATARRVWPGAVRGLGLPDEFSAVTPSERGRSQCEGGRVKVGTEQEWQAAREELLVAERELEEHAKRVEEQRHELPWVPVEKEYTFATEDGPKSLLELFEGRSQLLIYHLMFGEDWAVACPGCSSLADGLSGVVAHLNDRDVTLLCVSQAPLDKLVGCSTTATRSAGRRCPASSEKSSTWGSYSARRRSGSATTARRSERRTSSRPCR